MARKPKPSKEQIRILKEELGWVDKISSAEQSRADKLRQLSTLTGERVDKLKNEFLGLNKAKNVSEQIKTINQDMIQLSIKQKVIADEKLQTQKFAHDKALGIVNAEEEILDILREQKLEQDPAYKQKTKELEMLKKKVDREKEIDEWTGKWVEKWEDFKEITSDPKIATGMFMMAMTDEAMKFGSTMEGLKDDMALSNTQAASLADEMFLANIQGALFGISAKMNAEAMAGLAEGAASLKDLSGGAVVEVSKLSKK